MGYGYWRDRMDLRREQEDFSERGWKRQPLADWDAHWQRLSVPARAAFLNDVKGPTRPERPGGEQPSVSVEKFRPEVLAELTSAGFVRVEPGRTKSKPDRVVAEAGGMDFARRVRTIHRIRLLDPEDPGSLKGYLNVACYNNGLTGYIAGVLRDAGIETGILDEAEVRDWLGSAHWPGLVVKTLNDPIAERVLVVVRESGEPVPIDGLPDRVAGADPSQVRGALDRLVSRLAAFEGLNSKTLAIEVGLLPGVRAKLARAASRDARPPLVVCDSPRELGPDTGPQIDDTRAMLLEVASEPPRLRQDGALFSKEQGRFLQAITPLPTWIEQRLNISKEDRLNSAFTEATSLDLVKSHREGKEVRLQLTPRGQAWLSADTKDQYAQIFKFFRELPKQAGPDLDFDLTSPFGSQWYGYYPYYQVTDKGFLGSTVTVVPARRGKDGRGPLNPKADDIKALRDALGRAFMALSLGVYHRLDSVVEHLVFRDQNVLLLGRGQQEVRVVHMGRVVPALEEAREAAGRDALHALMFSRLIPLGCLRTAVDDSGQLCVARTPRLGAYFGFEPLPDEPEAGSGSRVVVQPDFSVVVIGLETAALAELAPFCERPVRGHDRGATVLKITRDSVTRAIAQGLRPQQILDRLRKHARPEPPANVLREVREWGDWIKPVTTQRLTVIRCPDRDTADRVASALKQTLERLNDTTLALDADRLPPADRKKLRDQGILVEASIEPAPTGPFGPVTRQSRRRRY
jgi:hypothetical protein